MLGAHEKNRPPCGERFSSGWIFEPGSRSVAYMRAIIASPKAEQDTSCAPSIRRAKS